MALVNILDQMEQANAAIQKELQDKLAKGQCLTDAELDQYQLTEDDKKVFYALWMVACIFLIGALWC